jgi:hypothetical protein
VISESGDSRGNSRVPVFWSIGPPSQAAELPKVQILGDADRSNEMNSAIYRNSALDIAEKTTKSFAFSALQLYHPNVF